MTATAPRRRPFRLRAPLLLGGAALLLGAHVGWTATRTVEDRLARDVARAVYNDNSALLEQVKAEAGAQVETLRAQVAAHPAPQDTAAVLVVSIHEKRLWYRRGDSVLFAAPIAVGSGKHFVVRGGSRVLHGEVPPSGSPPTGTTRSRPASARSAWCSWCAGVRCRCAMAR